MGNWDVELNPNKDGVKTELFIKQDVVNLIDELNAISFYEANEHSRECYYDIRNAVIAMQPVASCSDAISRQGLLDTIDRFCDLGKRQLKEIVRDLPPVTPKQSGWHYTDLPPSDDPYKRYLVVYSPYDRNYGRNTAPRFEIADYYKGDGLYNDKPWHLTISHSVMEKEILAWKDIGIVDEVMQGAKMVEPQKSEEISREEIAALLARGSEEMTREEAKVKTFDILRFIADNAGLSMFEAIEKAYYMGVSEQEPKTGHWIVLSPTDMCCSECNEIEHLDTSRRFCSYCGTRMSENPTGLESEE